MKKGLPSVLLATNLVSEADVSRPVQWPRRRLTSVSSRPRRPILVTPSSRRRSASTSASGWVRPNSVSR